MSKTYIIQWKSKVNGRAGRGTKQFNREEAEQLVYELNEEYPRILHEVIPWRPPPEHEEEQQEQPVAETSYDAAPEPAHHSEVGRKTYRMEPSSAPPAPELAIK